MSDEGYRIGEIGEELKRYRLNQCVIEPWDIFLDVILEKRVKELKNKNLDESIEKMVKISRNKNEEKSEEELKHYVDEYFDKHWCVSFDKFLENLEEGNEIKEWALKDVKRLKNKNKELEDKLDFSKLSNPEMNLRYSKLVNSNRRKINCLREENKKLKEQLRQKENITKEIKEKIENTTINCEGIAEDLIDDIYEILGGTDEEII